MADDVTVAVEDYVATVEFHRPPNNFFDVPLIQALVKAVFALDDDPDCRAIVLCSEGKNFCAGADLGPAVGPRGQHREPLRPGGRPLLGHASRSSPRYRARRSAAGLGLALAADFRVATPDSRFSCNFAKLGFHQGFGVSVTLPAVVGQQRALELMYTGGQAKGAEALAIGLCDRLTSPEDLRDAAHEFASEIAASGPLAVLAIRETMRGELADRVRAATRREHEQQQILRATSDFQEGVAAMTERRPPRFTGS